MLTTTSLTAAPPTRAGGRLYLWLGLLVGLAGPAAYWLQLYLRHLTVPLYLPLAGTAAVGMIIAALVRKGSVWRILALLFLGLLAAGEWAVVTTLRLPPYTGPVAVGRPFPAFSTTWVDGSRITEGDLKGDQNTVMVFFRGHW